MDIRISEVADRHLRRSVDQGAVIRLMFDAEGCGCGVNGLPALWILDKPEPNDLVIESNSVPFYISKWAAIYYEEHLQLDAEVNYPAFRLFSNSQTYSSNVQLIDKRASLS